MAPMPAGKIVVGTFAASLLPFLLVEIFHPWLYVVMDAAGYLVFHNIVEFFSVVVSLSIFGVGWFTHEQSHNRHVLFLSSAFLAVGLLDFMHALGYTGMPAFVSENSITKASQFWIAARLVDASAFLVSAYIHPHSSSRLLSKRVLLPVAVATPVAVFTGVTFFPEYVPATFVAGAGLTPFKKISEYLIIALLALASAAYWKRISRTGDRMLGYCLAAFVICIFSELVFTFYKSVFDTYNFLGHVYKVLAFALVYKGTFTTSVKVPWVRLSEEIEEHKAAREEIRTLNLGLEQRVRERTAQLEAANRELEAFSYSVSHDLRSPLRAIDGFANILGREYEAKLDAEGQRLLGIIRGGAQEMGQLIDDLLAFSRIGRVELRREEVRMHELTREIFGEVLRLEGGRSVQLALEPLLSAKGDPSLVRQVLHNLVSNAVKYTRPRESARIEIGCRPHEGENVYFIRDNGVGFDMKYSDKLFGVFQRLHRAEEFEGTGVGLAIVQRIVSRHGGRVWAESRKGEGAVFYFSLPSNHPQHPAPRPDIPETVTVT